MFDENAAILDYPTNTQGDIGNIVNADSYRVFANNVKNLTNTAGYNQSGQGNVEPDMDLLPKNQLSKAVSSYSFLANKFDSSFVNGLYSLNSKTLNTGDLAATPYVTPGLWQDGMKIEFIATNTNIGNDTIKINNSASCPILKLEWNYNQTSFSFSPLTVGNILQNQYVILYYSTTANNGNPCFVLTNNNITSRNATKVIEYTTPETYTYIPSAGCKKIEFVLIGGGGGGAGFIMPPPLEYPTNGGSSSISENGFTLLSLGGGTGGDYGGSGTAGGAGGVVQINQMIGAIVTAIAGGAGGAVGAGGAGGGAGGAAGGAAGAGGRNRFFLGGSGTAGGGGAGFNGGGGAGFNGNGASGTVSSGGAGGAGGGGGGGNGPYGGSGGGAGAVAAGSTIFIPSSWTVTIGAGGNGWVGLETGFGGAGGAGYCKIIESF